MPYTQKMKFMKITFKKLLIFGWILLLKISVVNAMEIWVANAGDNTLSVIQNKIIKTVSCGKGPREIVFLPKKQLVYVNECAQNSLAIYNLKTKQFLKRFKLPGEVRGVTVATNESRLYFVLKDRNELIEWDITKNEISRHTDTPRGPRNTVIDMEHQKIYVTCNTDNVVAVYDINSFQKITEIKTAQQPYALKLRKNILFVSSIGENLIQAFSTKDYKKNWETPSGKHPTSIDFDKTGNIIVTNFDTNQLTLLSGETGKVISTILTGRNPFSIQVISNIYLVSNLGDNTLNLYDDHGNVLATHNVGKEPHGFSILNYGEVK